VRARLTRFPGPHAREDRADVDAVDRLSTNTNEQPREHVTPHTCTCFALSSNATLREPSAASVCTCFAGLPNGRCGRPVEHTTTSPVRTSASVGFVLLFLLVAAAAPRAAGVGSGVGVGVGARVAADVADADVATGASNVMRISSVAHSSSAIAVPVGADALAADAVGAVVVVVVDVVVVGAPPIRRRFAARTAALLTATS
jgi:hypothetical protein